MFEKRKNKNEMIVGAATSEMVVGGTEQQRRNTGDV
jgi:hypothetical protein